ncbi:hypothetical protein [Deinococcus planocerae]|uniref:hypothetical protein n=1 Tax=Deinococcus planocerae TaxID=1737569 RepID=UPI001FE42B7C|nr:hypothetical protein [Deinococcus planocerae]
MSVVLLLLLGVAGWAVACAWRSRSSPRSRLEAGSGWKSRPARMTTVGRRVFPNRLIGRGRPGTPLLPVPFRPGDLVRVDGEWYHLPTLRRLHRAGRLTWGSPGWRALEQAERGRRLN